MKTFLEYIELNEATERDIPHISKWQTFAGGTGAAEGKYSHTHTTKHGTYYVDPVTTKEGRHNGYVLRFTHNGQKPSSKVAHSGLWHNLGKHRSPDEAVKAARSHHEQIKE